jgi:hypothetical protein
VTAKDLALGVIGKIEPMVLRDTSSSMRAKSRGL